MVGGVMTPPYGEGGSLGVRRGNWEAGGRLPPLRVRKIVWGAKGKGGRSGIALTGAEGGIGWVVFGVIFRVFSGLFRG